MSETTSTTSNGYEILNPVEKLEAEQYQNILSNEFGIDGKNPQERAAQLKDLSQEGVAILIERINALAQGSGDSLMNHDKAMRLGNEKIGYKYTISPEHRYDVFTKLIDDMKATPDNINPARLGDALALGIVMLHPFHDGNGRTARLIGMTFREDYDDKAEYDTAFKILSDSRDTLRAHGGFVVNGYVPQPPGGLDSSSPEEVANYLSSLLHDEAETYTGPYGSAPLYESLEPKDDVYEKEERIVEDYEKFRELVEACREGAPESDFLGSGAHSLVYKVEKDGKDYVVRFVKPVKQHAEILHSHIAAGARAKGIRGLENITAGSYEDGVIVSEMVHGSHLESLSPEQVAFIPDTQFDALVDRRLEALDKGIQFDSHPDNILYNSETGFTDIDYHVEQGERTWTVDRVNAMKTVLDSLDLTEVHLRTNDLEIRDDHEAVKDAFLKRINKYMTEKFNKEDYDQLWEHLVKTVAWRRTGHEIAKKATAKSSTI